jgi:uncharacterized metal-binding protein
MPSLPRPKVGIVSCSGEELAEGTVSRLATLEVLQKLRPADTVTICLPLFLAGGEEDRAFARHHPTITVDGCDLRCAARGTETYSARPAASVVVSDLARKHGVAPISGCRRLNEAGRQAVEITAARVATLVDEVLASRRAAAGAPEAAAAAGAPEAAAAASTGPQQEVVATCSCGSGIPVSRLAIAGREVEVVALPPILAQLREAGRKADEALGGELLRTVRIYNSVPPDEEAAWTAALLAEYVAGAKEPP